MSEDREVFRLSLSSVLNFSFYPEQPDLISEPGSALCTSARQNLAAVLGRHSLKETVLLLAMDLLGLVGSFNLSHFPDPLFNL